MRRLCSLPLMLDQTARVLRQSWTGGLLSALLVTVFLIGSTCHAESGSTQASPDPTTAVATPSADYEASGPGEAHEHRSEERRVGEAEMQGEKEVDEVK